jgi:hypothetical protein
MATSRATAPQQKDLAAALGVDQALITRYKRRGMPVHSVEAALQWRAENVRQRAGGAATAVDAQAAGRPRVPTAARAGDYQAARTRREEAEASKAELELARLEGAVLDRERTLRGVLTAWRVLRDQSSTLGRTLAPTLAALQGEAAIRQAVERAIADLQGAFAAKLTALANDAQAAAARDEDADDAPLPRRGGA